MKLHFLIKTFIFFGLSTMALWAVDNRTFLDTLNMGKEVSIVKQEKIAQTIQKPNDSPAVSSKPTPSPLPKSSQDAAESLQIQVAAFKSKSSAEKAISKIASHTELKATVIKEATFYKVFILGTMSRPSAEKNIVSLKKLGFKDAWLISK